MNALKSRVRISDNEIIELIQDIINENISLINKHYPDKILEELRYRLNKKSFKRESILFYPDENEKKFIFLEKVKPIPYTCLSSNSFDFDKQVYKQWKELGYVVRKDITWYKVKDFNKNYTYHFMKGELISFK